MSIHTPIADLSRSVALSGISETAIRNFEAMTVGERRHRHECATMEAIRNDLLARRPNHPDTAYYRSVADNHRKMAAALKAIGL